VETFSRRKTDLKDDWNKFSQSVEYHLMDLESEKTYKAIGAAIKEQEEAWDVKASVIFLMSVAPQLAPVIAQNSHKAKLCDDPARSRMVFEKPFGH
jgi:glucose-6-phosphate 1-dehydrogenase